MIGGPAAALNLRQAAQQGRDLDVRAVDVRIGNAEGCRGLIDILFKHQMAAVSTDVGSLDHEVASNLLLDVSIPLLSVAVGVMNVEQGAGGPCGGVVKSMGGGGGRPLSMRKVG